MAPEENQGYHPSLSLAMVGTVTAPPPGDVHVLIPVTCKRDFADVVKLRVLRWGDFHAFSGQADSNHMNP